MVQGIILGHKDILQNKNNIFICYREKMKNKKNSTYAIYSQIIGTIFISFYLFTMHGNICLLYSQTSALNMVIGEKIVIDNHSNIINCRPNIINCRPHSQLIKAIFFLMSL